MADPMAVGQFDHRARLLADCRLDVLGVCVASPSGHPSLRRSPALPGRLCLRSARHVSDGRIIANANIAKALIHFRVWKGVDRDYDRPKCLKDQLDMPYKSKSRKHVSGSGDETEPIEAFHERLAAILKCESSNASFAKRAGVSQSGFHRIVHGGEPGLKTLLGIAGASGASVRWLTGGKVETASDCHYEEIRLLDELNDVRKTMDKSKSIEELENLRDLELLIKKLLSANNDMRKILDKHNVQAPITEIIQQQGAYENPSNSLHSPIPEEFVLVPRYDVQASAGPGMFADHEAVVDHMA